MDMRTVLLSLICAGALLVAGCTSATPAPAPATPAPVTTTLAAPTPMNAMGCVEASDCVPAQCCHATSCINKVARKNCDGNICTASCEGPLDCGAGSCGCVQGKCTVVAAQETTAPAATPASVRIWATPQRYSLIMSSTPGIELSVITTGTGGASLEYDWKASYGHFLSWNPPDYSVNEKGPAVTTRDEKIYWSFTEQPSSTASPVVITVTARDTLTNKDVGRSTLTLAWDGTNSVTVNEIT